MYTGTVFFFFFFLFFLLLFFITQYQTFFVSKEGFSNDTCSDFSLFFVIIIKHVKTFRKYAHVNWR